jgi:hypothetical protein
MYTGGRKRQCRSFGFAQDDSSSRRGRKQVTILEFFIWSLLKVAVVTVVLLMAVAYTVLL